MYYYLIDPSQYDGKNFEFFQTRLLSLIGEYQVSGEAARVTSLRRIEDLVATALSHGCKTLVVVGSDQTLVKVMTLCRTKDITLAFVPLNSRSESARILGTDSLDQAVATIAKRRVVRMDVAKINDKLFISTVNFGFLEKQVQKQNFFGFNAIRTTKPVAIEFRIDDRYTIADRFFAGSIVNTRDTSFCTGDFDTSIGSPLDGFLDLVLVSKTSKYQIWKNRKKIFGRCFETLHGSTVVRAKKIKISSQENLGLFISGHPIATAPATVEFVKEKLRMIVGRNRQF